jgi:glycosyltransferase involved in cell wall biosynthesis
MRIGVDARELVGHVTGVGRYLGGLLNEWTASGATSRHHVVLYAPAPLPAEYSAFHVRVLPARSAGTLWQQTTLASAARRDSLDVFFAPQYTAPLFLDVPVVLVLYDISFVAHPEWFRTREGARLRMFTRFSTERSRDIITISEFSRREIGEHLRVDRRRIHVIPPGVALRTSMSANAHPPGRRLLYVGSIFNRRHVPDLIGAFSAVARAHPDASLDLVGDNRSYPFEDVTSAIEREALGDRIRWHRYAAEEQLAELYRRASAFAFFSEYEGLGMTPLEALAAGAPSVLYDTPVARESCGDAALYVPAGDHAAATRAIETLLYDEATRTRLLAAAAGTLARYSWTRAAVATLRVLERRT